MNRIVLVGRLTKDPELRFTQSNKAVATFTIAVNRNFKNANGETEADFINIVAWGKQAKTIKQYVFKGHQIGIDGRIQTRNYKDNQDRTIYVTEVVAESFTFLEPKKEQTQNTNQQIQHRQQAPQTQTQTQTQEEALQTFGANIDIQDDDLPFN